MLHFIAAQAARARPADRRRRHQRPAARRASRCVALAREHHVLAGRDRARPARGGLPGAQRARGRTATSARTSSASQRSQLRRSLRGLQREGFRHVSRPALARGGRRGDDRARAAVDRPPRRARPVRHHRRRPRLLRRAASRCSTRARLRRSTATDGRRVTPPDGRRAVFVGDLVDRGPRHAGRAAARDGHGRGRRPRSASPATTTCKLRRASCRAATCRSRTASPRRSRSSTREPPRVPRRACATFLDGLVSHYVLDDGKLVVAHAGMKEELQGRASGARARRSRCTARRPARPTSSACRCATTGPPTTAAAATVVYGHTPVPEPEWLNNTIYIDTGCVFGGTLTALRYPERELVSVPAARDLLRAGAAVPGRRRRGAAAPTQQQPDDVLDLDGRRRQAHRRDAPDAHASRSARRTRPRRSR